MNYITSAVTLDFNRRIGLLLLLVAAITGFFHGEANGESLSAVTLLYFRGTGQDGAVLLEWATATELATIGFQIERAEQIGGPYKTLTQIGFVPSAGEPGGISGAEYEEVDSVGVVDGKTYWYVLVEIEVDGTENRIDPISVVAGRVQPTATSTVARGPTSTPVPQSTSNQSATATATPPPTSTSRSSSGQQVQVTTVGGDDPRSNVSNSSGAQASATQVVTSGSGSNTSASAQTLAQTQATPVDESYPSLLSSTPYPANGSAEGIDDAYVGPQGSPPDQPSSIMPEGYPAGEQDDSSSSGGISPQALPGIGQNTSQDDGTGVDGGTSEGSLAGTIVLWLGFAIGLLLFIATVVGSIYYFTRQRAAESR